MNAKEPIPLIGRDALASSVRRETSHLQPAPALGDRPASADEPRGGAVSRAKHPVLGVGRDFPGPRPPGFR
jgi:hypothetical protein